MKNHQNHIMKRASRNLSNRADGASETIIVQSADPNIDTGLDKFFTVTVQNHKAAACPFALIPANFDTERYVINDGAVVKTYDNIDALRAAGYMVGGVLADGHADYKSTDDTDVDITCASNDAMKTIKQFLDFVKLNPQQLKHLDIISSNINQWSSSLTITFCNPFFDNKRQRVNLTPYFSRFQYQNDRIGIDFQGNALEVSDLLLLVINIPASTTAQFVMTF